MAIFASDAFNGPSGQNVSVHDPKWILHPTMAPGIIAVIDNTLSRIRGGTRDERYYYYNEAPPTADYDVEIITLIVASGTGISPVAGALGRLDPTLMTCYYADIRSTGVSLFKRVNGGFNVIGTPFNTVISNGIEHTLTLRMVGSTISVLLNGIVRISVTDPDISAAGLPGFYLRSNGSLEPSNANGIRINNWLADGELPPAQDLIFTPAISRSVVSDVTLVRETVYLDFNPAESESHTAVPTLVGGTATLASVPAESRSRVALPVLTSGDGLMVSPVKSQSKVSSFALEPGPITRDSPQILSQSKVRVPSLALAIVLPSVPSFSRSYTRRPTLKSRFDCCSLAPLQVRAKAQTLKEGSGCGPGVRGSDGFVQW